MTTSTPNPALNPTAGRAEPAPRADEPLPRYCTNHPERETYIACGRCERPFCPDCLIQSPAGQRCYECAGVRRDFAQRNFARRVGQAFGALTIGGAIAALLPGIFFVLFAGLIAGGAAGQSLSPLVNRRTRGQVYLLGLLALFVGTLVGWTVASVLLLTARVPLGMIPIDAVVVRTISTLPFWLFTLAAGAVGYQRVR